MNLPFEITANLIAVVVIVLVAMASAVGVVAFTSAVRSALCLVVNFFMIAFLYFTLNAEMLGISQIVVYAGAIMVLFLFVIMLLNLGAVQGLEERVDIKKFVGGALGLALLLLIAATVLQPLAVFSDVRAPVDFGTPQTVGRTLFTMYLLPFEIASILLLVGIVGSILLAKRRI